MLDLFLSSGDLLADRRYQHAKDFEARGDLAAAADLLAQAVERAPEFASAWFALGDVRERCGDAAGAIAAFTKAHALDDEDRHGAALRLARLGATDARFGMSPGYVRTLFDQYASRFDEALDHLGYRAPALLRAAIEEVSQASKRPANFRRMIDLGCGTGLAGQAFAETASELVGVDLSPGMIVEARRKGIYARLETADLLQFLGRQDGASADLVIAADVLVYIADLAPICRQVARVLCPTGFFAFTAETHEGEGVILGSRLRYAHAANHVHSILAAAGLDPVKLESTSTRNENGIAVRGLLAVAAHAHKWTAA
jgi:predicted TPR repeat methyltransferase